MHLGRLITPLLLSLAIALPAGSDALAPGAEAPVRVVGYSDDIMEPFVTRDGKWLIFNNSNAVPHRTDLHIAAAAGPMQFKYKGKLAGVNTADLDGVASVDDAGQVYYVSVSAYPAHLSTIHRARLLKDGTATDAALVPGLARGLGWFHFDAEISPDGSVLYLAEGWFDGGPLPKKADLFVAQREGGGFRIDRKNRLFAKINTSALEYAPAVSRDGKVLYFTRWKPGEGVPRIFKSLRQGKSFGAPMEVATTGYVEAASIAPDGRMIYFHRKTPRGFRLFARGVAR